MNSPEGTFVPGPIMLAVLLLLSVSSVSTQAQSQASDNSPKPTLRTPGDITQALRACFIAPPAENTFHGMRITLRLSFNRKGEALVRPAAYQLCNAECSGAGADGLQTRHPGCCEPMHAFDICSRARRSLRGPTLLRAVC
jgi:hypothetical protein